MSSTKIPMSHWLVR
jgi:hypothetical protein